MEINPQHILKKVCNLGTIKSFFKTRVTLLTLLPPPQKGLAVLKFGISVDSNIMDDTDLAGPVFFCLLFGVFLLAVSYKRTKFCLSCPAFYPV